MGGRLGVMVVPCQRCMVALPLKGAGSESECLGSPKREQASTVSTQYGARKRCRSISSCLSCSRLFPCRPTSLDLSSAISLILNSEESLRTPVHRPVSFSTIARAFLDPELAVLVKLASKGAHVLVPVRRRACCGGKHQMAGPKSRCHRCEIKYAVSPAEQPAVIDTFVS